MSDLSSLTGEQRAAEGNPQRGASATELEAGLTPREVEVLALLASGEKNKSIARLLQIAEGTVKTHVTSIFKKLKVSTRTRASQAAAVMARVSDEQRRKMQSGELTIRDRLCHESPRTYRQGAILFRKGAQADALYYIQRGTVLLEELNIERGAGELLGEIGLFAPHGRRMASARCLTECELVVVTAEDAMKICMQDPGFAVFMARLLTRRLQGG